MRSTRLPIVLALLLAIASAAEAQLPGFKISKQLRLDRLGENHWRASGQVEMEDNDLRFFADVVDYYTDTNRIEASGNVVAVTRDSRIAADRAQFDTKTRTGAFYNASGVASLGDRVDRSFFGPQEADAYFYGEKLEKLGPKKYRITNGGFTTCLQPTPRWEVVAASATITLESYAILRNSILRVKGVPLFYMPIFYYPVQEDDRATGFLIPVYGSSTVRGQSLSNAFFWAINRSSDATFFHDWFTRTGQGQGGEYRYVSEPGSAGSFRTYWLNEHAAVFTSPTGTQTTTPARRSYEIRANAVQRLPARLRARGNIDYFSNVTVQQTYHGDLYDASRRQRSIGANVAGGWGANSLSFTYNRAEVFYGQTDSILNGVTPRLFYSRGATQLGPLPVYFSANADYSRLLRTTRSSQREIDEGLGRFDASPTIRAPLAKLSWFSVNSSMTWRATWWSRATDSDEAITRSYFDMRADATGPTFTRIWDTPSNGYAEKFKHVIEPSAGISRVTLIDNFDRIPKNDTIDFVIGGTTRLNYGLTNRFLAKTRANRQAREFLTVTLFQTYYTDAAASQYDPSFGTSFLGRKPSNFSPVQLTVRTLPTDQVNGSIRLEYDYTTGDIITFRANGAYAAGDQVQVIGGWSRRRIDQTRSDNFLDLGSNVRGWGGRVGGSYNLAYDFFRDRLLTQRLIGYYHAQCCGVAFEFQKFAFPLLFPVPADTRFNISFTLAGVGSFSNFFGALSGTGSSQRRF